MSGVEPSAAQSRVGATTYEQPHSPSDPPLRHVLTSVCPDVVRYVRDALAPAVSLCVSRACSLDWVDQPVRLAMPRCKHLRGAPSDVN